MDIQQSMEGLCPLRELCENYAEAVDRRGAKAAYCPSATFKPSSLIVCILIVSSFTPMVS